MSDAKPVAAPDTTKKNSEIMRPTSDETTVQMSEIDAKCYWNDEAFDTGQQVSSEGKCYECSFGCWTEVS